jgi:hypothetical protein
MIRPKKLGWFPANRSLRFRHQARRQRAARRLLSDMLEQRILLAAVTSEDPVAESSNAPGSTNVSATYDEPITPASATPQNFVVRSEMSANTTTVSVTGNTITADPANNFFPGEQVRVTSTAGIQGTTAGEKSVWQFRAGVTAGSGRFEDSGQVLGSNINRDIVFGDVDGDGDVDALNGGDVLFINDGTGVFTDSGQRLGAGTYPSSRVEFGDIDGDGDLDAVGLADVLTNNGSGVFTSTGQNLPDGSTRFNESINLGDLDGDGDLDAITNVNYTANPILINNGSGTFVANGQGLGASSSSGIEFADLDADGDLDVFISNNGAPNRVYFNDGNANFMDSGQALGGFRASTDVDLGDLDGDGDVDAFVSNNQRGNSGNRVWLNDGNGAFTDTGVDIGPREFNYEVELGDLDNDGDLDAYVVSIVEPNRVHLNDGNGNFTDSGQLIASTSNGTYGVDLADVDGDGDLDAWEANITSNGSRLKFNVNLQPSVSLAADQPTIAEAAGAATVTATLSAAHTEVVTVELGTSGTATATDDYSISGTQIVIPAGSTSGSVTVTAVQDAMDDDDETVIVDITGVTNADEAGTQQAVITIVDDDDPPPVPDVTLSVDNTSIPEGGGGARFSVTLSEATTVPVIVDLGFSGSAIQGVDYIASSNQISVAPGATTGSVTVIAIQDPFDEPDETVTVAVTNVTGGNEAGVQEATTTINDDDDPLMPGVTLSVDNAEIPEAAGVATFTAMLSETTTVDVTVDLELTGTATPGDDYNASGTQITIAAGATTGSVTVTAVQDELDEPNETVLADISGVTNGTETDNQQATTTIADDDEPQGFAVSELTPTASGFQVTFTNPVDDADLNLIDSETAGLGPADVVLTGTSSGPVAGSVVVFERMVEFIKTGDPLAPDNYAVTLRSAANGFKDTDGMLLDGNGDGTPGDDYSMSFVVDEPAANQVTVGIPDIVRGPGQEVNLPANETTGIPLSLSDGTNIRAIDARIAYDPARLNITAAAVGPDAPAGASVVLNSSTPGLAILVYFSSTPLAAGEVVPINLTATVPADNASDNYGSPQVLDVHDVVISDGNDNESPVLVDKALHVVTFFADVTANGRLNAADAAGIARVAALLDGGFTNTPLSDPGLLGDISGNNRLNAADASLAAQAAALIPVDQIPPIPGGVVITGLFLSPPESQPSRADEPEETLACPVSLDFADYSDLGMADVNSTVELLAESRDTSSKDPLFEDLLDELVNTVRDEMNRSVDICEVPLRRFEAASLS